MHSQENSSTQFMMINRKGKFATEQIENSVTGTISGINSLEGSKMGWGREVERVSL